MERRDCTAVIQGQLVKYRPLLDIKDICSGLDDTRTADINLSHDRTVVMPAVVRKKKLKSCAKVGSDTGPARLAQPCIWRECMTEGWSVRIKAVATWGFAGKLSCSQAAEEEENGSKLLWSSQHFLRPLERDLPADIAEVQIKGWTVTASQNAKDRFWEEDHREGCGRQLTGPEG